MFSQAPSFSQIPRLERFGIDGFRLMLQQEGLVTTQTQIGTALENAQSTVVVILGDLRVPLQMRNQLERFVDRGGSLLVASDIGLQKNRFVTWFPSTRAQFRYRPPTTLNAYRGYHDCPVITEFNSKAFPDLFDGIDTLITNRPAQLTFSSKVTWAADFAFESRRSRQRLMGVTKNRKNNGRVLLVADHSLFINEMLLHGDNARFASNVAKWLTSDGNRSTLVIIHDNRVLGEWSMGGGVPDVPLQDLLRAANRFGLDNLPIGETMLPILNQSLGEFERQGQHNSMVRRFAYGLVGPRPYRAICILLTILLLVWAARWLFFTRGRPQRWLFPKREQNFAETNLSAAFREQQYQPYLKSLAREFFLELGVPEVSNMAVSPAIQANSSLRQQAYTDIQMFWNIATGSNEKKLTKSTFNELVRKLRDLHRLQINGALRLEGVEKSQPVVQ